MAWNELKGRGTQKSVERIKQKIEKLSDCLDELLEEIEEMEEEFGERDSMNYGERDEYGERRGVRGTGRYGRR